MKKLFPKDKIIVTNYFDVHQDWEIPIPGLFIIAAKRKLRSIADFTEKESQDFIKLLCKLRKGMKDILKIKDVYLFQNEDTKHNFHLWMFPRYKWMNKFGKKIQSVRPIIDYAKRTMTNKEKIKEVKITVKLMKQYMKQYKD